MKYIIISIMIVLTINTYAKDFELIMSLNTTHNKELTYFDYNNDNDLIAIKYKRLVIGHMINSFGRESWLLAYNQPLKHNFSVMVGGASGYRNKQEVSGIIDGEVVSGFYRYPQVINNKIMPMVLLTYKIKSFYLSTSGGFNMILYTIEF